MEATHADEGRPRAGSPTRPTSTGSRRRPPTSHRRWRRSRRRREPERVPIVDRDAGRVLSVLAGGRRRIVEVGTAYGYSTLWLALGQPADGTIVTIDPDRRGPTSPGAGGARPASPDERITVRQSAKALEAFAAERAGARRAVRPGVHRRAEARVRAYLEALVAGPPGPGRAGRRRQRPVERSRVRSDARRRRRATATPPPCARSTRAVLGDPRFTATILPVGDGLLVATWRGLTGSARRCASGSACSRSSASSPARGRCALELADGATVEDAWAALVDAFPVLAPGRRVGPVRPQRRLRRRRRRRSPTATRSRCIPPVSGGRTTPARRRHPRAARDPFDAGDPGRADRSARDPRGRRGRSGSSAGPASRPGRRRRARRPRRPATPAGRSSRSSTRPTRRWRSQSWRRSPTRSPSGSASTRLAIVHRTGEVPLGDVSHRGRGGRAASRRGIRGRPLRDRRDEGARADLEGRAVRRRPRLDRRSRHGRGPEEGA